MTRSRHHGHGNRNAVSCDLNFQVPGTFPPPVFTGHGKNGIPFPRTSKNRWQENGIPFPGTLYILRIYKCGTGMCGHPPLRVGAHEHAPTHGREPTQHKREMEGKEEFYTLKE